MKTVETIGVVVLAIALDVLSAGALTPVLGATTAAIIGSLAAAGVLALGQTLLTPAQKRTLSVRDPIASHKVIMGQMKVGGAVTFIDTSSDNQTLYMVVTVAAHPLRAIDGLYINDTFVPLSSNAAQKPPKLPDGTQPTDYSGHLHAYYGLGTVAGDAAMIAQIASDSPKWGPNFFQYCRGKIYLRLNWSTNLFGSTGVPNISVVVRGRMVLDPRDTGVTLTTSTAANPAVFSTSGSHNLVPGDMAFIDGHSGAVPANPQPYWPAAQRGAVSQEYEVATTPSGTTFTLYSIDTIALALSVGGSGGTVTKMKWSDNSSLAVNDYLVEPVHGMAVLYESEVDASFLITQANICDEIVARAAPTATFTADAGSDQITYTENLAIGALPPICEVLVSNSGGGLPGGLAANTVYYWAQVGAGPIGYLCSSAANAYHVPPVPVNITSAGTGTQTLQIVESFTADHTTGQLSVFSNTLRLVTGTQVQVSNIGGALPSGLSAATNYYTIFFCDTIVLLATTLDNARKGIAISLSNNGSGTSFIQVEAEPRYTANGLVDTQEPRQSVIQKMLTSMGGWLVPSGTLLNAYPAAYLTPTVTLNEDDLRGPISVVSLQTGATSFNSVKGTFLDPFSKGQPTDYPNLQNSTYLAEDQYEVVWRDLTLDFTNSSSMAQRLAKIELERIRRELTVSMPLKLTAFQVGSPDTIYVNNTMWGWSGETFEVQTWQFSITGDEGGNQALNCDITGRQTDSAVYAWTSAEEQAAKRQSNTNLPNPFIVQPPTALGAASGGSLVVQQADGTLVSQVQLTWTAPVDQFVLDGGFIETLYQLVGAGSWTQGPTVPGAQTFAVIPNCQIGQAYNFTIRARNAIGAVSDPTPPYSTELTNYTILGKTAAPSNIASISVTVNPLTVILSGAPITDTDVVTYEYRYGASAVWASMTLLEQVAAIPNGNGTVAGTCTSSNVPAGTWYFAVEAINRSGVYSATAAFSGATHVVVNQVNTPDIVPFAATSITNFSGGTDVYTTSSSSGSPHTIGGTTTPSTTFGANSQVDLDYTLKMVTTGTIGVFDATVSCVRSDGVVIAGQYEINSSQNFLQFTQHFFDATPITSGASTYKIIISVVTPAAAAASTTITTTVLAVQMTEIKR